MALQVSGWFEGEAGAVQFAFEASDMRGIARQLVEMDQDVAGVDLEAVDQDGEDVTERLYRSLNALSS